MSTFKDVIKKIYKKAGYLDKYGGSAIATVLILSSFFLAFSYYYVIAHIKPIKKNWVKERYDPSVMPWAGMINAPPGKSKFEFTAENFSDGVANSVKELLGYILQPIYYVCHQITEVFSLLAETINSIRKVFNDIKNNFKKITIEIFDRMLAMLIPLQKVFAKIKDMFSKTQGVLITGLLTVMGIYDTLKSLIGGFLELLIIALILLVAMFIIFWLMPWTWPMAIIATAIFVFLSIPTIIMIYWFAIIFNLTQSHSVPSGACFDEKTSIKTKKGYKNISEIKIGDILADGSKVTTFFKLSAKDQPIYDYNGIIVSGSHSVLTKNGWVYISEHPCSKRIGYKKPFLYCLNTSTQKICIDKHVFADWLDIEDEEWRKIKKLRFKKRICLKNKNDLHKYFEMGFGEHTMLQLIDGNWKYIKNIEVGDRLWRGERILGIVEIDATHILEINKCTIGKQSIIVGNLELNCDDLGDMDVLNKRERKGVKKLYHLLTDTKYLNIENTLFHDYNWSIERLL